MLFQSIEGANLLLRGNGEDILDIHARSEIVGDYREITVAFEPTPAELARLNEGKPVYVTQLGNSFHPIRVEVKL
jgi:hypothetical protein